MLHKQQEQIYELCESKRNAANVNRQASRESEKEKERTEERERKGERDGYGKLFVYALNSTENVSRLCDILRPQLSAY